MKKNILNIIIAVSTITALTLGACGGEGGATSSSSGSLDTTFNTTGIVTTPIGTGSDIANDVAIQSDGKIVAAGWYWNGSNDDFALARYNTDGSLDTTFNTTGIVTTPIGTVGDRAYAVAIQSDGKIVAVGWYWNGSSYDCALVRYLP